MASSTTPPLTERVRLTLTASERGAQDAAIRHIAAYLESARHCRGQLVTRDPSAANTYILNATWDSPRWRALAWRYFMDALAAHGIRYQVVLDTHDERAWTKPEQAARG